MVKSIRVRLLLWSAAMLILVVGGFATLVFLEYRATRYAEVDAQLELAANALDSGLRLFPHYDLRGEPAPTFEGKEPKEPKGPNGPRDPKLAKKDLPPPMPPQQRERLLNELGPPNRLEGLYFGVWRADGSVVKSSGLTNETPRPFGARPRPDIITREKYRELVVLGPHQSLILVGRSLDKVQSDVRSFAISLIVAGVLIMVPGLAGGWLISRRIFQPIASISETASRISAESLSQRIDEKPLDVELVDLARVLNDTFQNLEESFERQKQFTADASHELRTPLAVLRSQAELALSRPRTPEEYQKALEACLRAAERMTELTNRLLKLAQADAGQLKLKLEPVPLIPFLKDTLSELLPLAQQREVKVKLDVEPVVVMADAPALGQVIANLVTNGILYNNPRGYVRVQSQRNGNIVRITVTDTGAGIPASDIPHLFERFYRVDKARSRSQGGFGLGLAICKTLIDNMGGKIGCQSTEGEGSTFWVELRQSDEV